MTKQEALKWFQLRKKMCLSDRTHEAEDIAIECIASVIAQEPRVLTLEEVQDDCPDYVYQETSTGWFGYCIKDEGESDKYVGYFVYGVDEYFIERWKEYGKTWRCWDKMPSDEQRKETPWDGD